MTSRAVTGSRYPEEDTDGMDGVAPVTGSETMLTSGSAQRHSFLDFIYGGAERGNLPRSLNWLMQKVSMLEGYGAQLVTRN